MKKVFLGLLVVFILMQMIRPNKNSSRNDINHISTVINVPDQVQEILKKSCNDCHSNFTNYPWYSEIAPVSWYLASHVNDGKKHMNLSDWTVYNKNQQDHILKDFEEVVETHEMPLKSYLILHKDAKLTAEQYEVLMNWLKSININ